MIAPEHRFPLGAEWARIQEARERGLEPGELHLDDPYVCFPLPSEWRLLQPKAREPYPAPAVSSRDDVVFDYPTAVRALRSTAEVHGWQVKTQYSQGHLPHGGTGKPTALRDLVGLRFGGHLRTNCQAYAVYSRTAGRGTWSWSSTLIWGPSLPPYAGCSYNDLRAFLEIWALGAASTLRGWVNGLREAAQATEKARKRRASVRREIRKVAMEGQAEAARQESRLEWNRIDTAWREKVAKLAEDVFTSDEVRRMLEIKVVSGAGLR